MKQRQLIMRDVKVMAAESLGKGLSGKMGNLEALKAELGSNSTISSEIQFKQIEVDVLTDVYRQLRRSLELDEVEMNAPARIRQVQPAVVSPD